MAKTECPITRGEFLELATPIKVVIAGKELELEPHEFKTDSFGYKVNEKVILEIAGQRMKCQVGLNITVIGSKHAD